METRTCPAGGTVSVTESPTDPSERPDRYWDVSCSICGHVGTAGPHVARAGTDPLVARHLADGYRKHDRDPEPSHPTADEIAEAHARAAEAHLPGGKFYSGPVTADEEAAARRALAELDDGRHTVNRGEPHG